MLYAETKRCRKIWNETSYHFYVVECVDDEKSLGTWQHFVTDAPQKQGIVVSQKYCKRCNVFDFVLERMWLFKGGQQTAHATTTKTLAIPESISNCKKDKKKGSAKLELQPSLLLALL